MVPSLFIAHGSPMVAIEQSEYGTFLDRLGRTLPRPKAVVLFSAHWESAVQQVSEVSTYSTIYDFGGFPDALYRVTYSAKGAPDLSLRVQDLLRRRGIEARGERQRGLDHGAWTLLKRLYPHADIPVVEMSVNAHLSPAEQFRIGETLAPLRAEDVLVIGSGVTVHNFQLLGANASPAVQAAVREFEEWLVKTLEAWDVPALFDYERQAPHAHLAVPPAGREHIAPLFYAMGAADSPDAVTVLHQSWMWNVMANSVYQFL